MINSFGWQTVVATPPITTQGLRTVCPPVTDVPASSDASLNPWMISGITLSLSCKDPGNSQLLKLFLKKTLICNTPTSSFVGNLLISKCCCEHGT